MFVDPLDVLLSDTSPRFPTIRLEVATQAVFLAANTECELIPTQEMKDNALNRKLQDFCLSVGILCYVSMYSFRRQAAQEAKRDHSTEDAMALLDHAPNNPNTMRHYDQHGFGRRDVTSIRLGGAALTDSSIRKFFFPSNRLVSTYSFQLLLPTHENPLAHTRCLLILRNCSGSRIHRQDHQ